MMRSRRLHLLFLLSLILGLSAGGVLLLNLERVEAQVNATRPATIPFLTEPAGLMATNTPRPLSGTLFPPLTPVFPSSPPPSPTASCPNGLPSRLVVGERGRVAADDPTPLNIRVGPGTNNQQIAQIPALGIFYVLDGPECTERYTWFRVAYRQNGETIIGWIAEGDREAYFVEMYPAGY